VGVTVDVVFRDQGGGGGGNRAMYPGDDCCVGIVHRLNPEYKMSSMSKRNMYADDD